MHGCAWVCSAWGLRCMGFAVHGGCGAWVCSAGGLQCRGLQCRGFAVQGGCSAGGLRCVGLRCMGVAVQGFAGRCTCRAWCGAHVWLLWSRSHDPPACDLNAVSWAHHEGCPLGTLQNGCGGSEACLLGSKVCFVCINSECVGEVAAMQQVYVRHLSPSPHAPGFLKHHSGEHDVQEAEPVILVCMWVCRLSDWC